MKLSLMFFPNLQKRSKKTDKIPMYMRIILDRKKIDTKLNIEMTQKEIEKWNDKVMRFDDREMSANYLLNTLDNKFEDFRHHNATSLSAYTLDSIRDLVLGIDKKIIAKPTIVSYLDNYYEKSVMGNSQLSTGTRKNYRKAINHLKNFLDFRKTRNALISSIDTVFAYEFKDYLLMPKSNDKAGMSEPSALNNVKRLRTIFDRAVEEQLLTINSFKKIKLKSRSVKRARLDINQVKTLVELDLVEYPAQNLYRDLFLFSVYTGLAYKDASLLKPSNLNKTKEGNLRLFLKRQKTGIETEMILPEQAVALITKYSYASETEILGTLLPRRSNKEINIQLKAIGTLANIPIRLSTHIARHTFRQLLAEADINEPSLVKRLMGHSNSNDIDSIYYSVTNARLIEAKTKLEKYLNKELYGRI